MQGKADPSARSAGNLVLTILERSARGLGISDSQRALAESLIWPFVARRSLRSKEWFTTDELRKVIKSMRKTIERIIKYTDTENREQTFIKYWLDLYMCQVFQDQQRPVKDDWIVDSLFSGYLRRFVARSIAKRDLSFIYSLAKGSKRMWPVLGEWKKHQTLLKHRQRFGEFHGECDADLIESIEKTSKEVFAKSIGAQGIKLVPSESACLQAARSKGGASSLFKPFDMEGTFKSDVARSIGKLRALDAGINKWRQATFDLALKEVLRDGESLFDLSVVPIAEPGKFRVITKGDGYLYTALQPLQGLLLSDWKNHKASTMKSEDLTTRIKQIDVNCKCDFFCSVDYEAATDLLKLHATLACMNELKGVPLYELAMEALKAPGVVRYPRVKGYPVLGNVLKADAQPMGHPLSFPILCCINLAVYRCAIKRWVNLVRERTERIRRIDLATAMWKNVIVNGDDMLFKCEESFYPVFIETATNAGLKISKGKNYLSKDMCMINSQVFQRKGGQMVRCGYLNLKLVKGTSLKEGDSSALPTQISKDLNRMVELCPWTKCVIPDVFSRWKEDWLGHCFRPNWYIPVHLGGYGVDLRYAPENWRVTREQRRMARLMFSNPVTTLYRTTGMKLPLARVAGAILSWKRIPETCPLRQEQNDETDPWLVRLALGFHFSQRGILSETKVQKSFDFRKLKPLNMDELTECWKTKLVSTMGPECPPLSYIRI